MIDSFRGPYAFLSNFYASPLTLGGITFPTAEHAFQAYKAQDEEWLQKIKSAPTPKEAKKLGRAVPADPDWDRIRFDVMRDVTRAKFRDNPELAEKLLATGNEILVEGNTWHDQTWGNCTCPKHHPEPGTNALGIILMGVRLDLMAKRRTS